MWLVTRKEDGQSFVLKRRICMDFAEANEGLSEAMALARFSHPNVVRYEDIFIENDPNDPDSLFLCIVMECCSGGDVFNLIHEQRATDTLLEPKVRPAKDRLTSCIPLNWPFAAPTPLYPPAGWGSGCHTWQSACAPRFEARELLS